MKPASNKGGRSERLQSLHAWVLARMDAEQRQDFGRAFHCEGRIMECFRDDCNLLLVAPHGFPGDDDNTDYLAFLLSRELKSSYLINNKKYRKPQNPSRLGIPADLNKPSSRNEHTAMFLGKLLRAAGRIRAQFDIPPLVVTIHGMADENAAREKIDFCIGAGYADSERQMAFGESGKATAPRSLVEGLLEGLKREGYSARDGIAGYTGEKSIPGYLKHMEGETGPVHAIQLEIRYQGFRDPPNLVHTSRLLGKVLSGLEQYRLRR